MAITPPTGFSFLSQPTTANNFLATQSASLAVTNTSSSVTFTNVPGTGRVTICVANSGTKGCYLASGHTAATAVASSATPAPANGNNAVSNCFYLAPEAIYTLDFVGGTNTFAAITAGSDTTTIEISVGWGA